MNKFEELVRGTMDVAKDLLREDQELVPVFLMGKLNGGGHEVMKVDTNSDKGKLISSAVMRNRVKSKGYDFVIMVAETWYRHSPDGVLAEGKRVADYEDKREAIMVAAETKDGHKMHLMAEIVRTELSELTFVDSEVGEEDIVSNKFFKGLWEE